MNPSQLTLYWREWRAAASALKELGKESDDVVRKALQADAIGGIDKSSKKLTNAELTRVLARFRSYSRPADFAAQMRAQEEPEARRALTIQQIERLAAESGIKGGLGGVSIYFKRWLGGKAVGLCDGDTLRKLVFILERRKTEQGPSTPPTDHPAPAAEAAWDGEF